MPEPFPQPLMEALRRLRVRLGGLQHRAPLGGSCGLMLQGVAVDRTPRDIDLYADVHRARQIDERLRSFATDRPRWDESELYRSVLSHYRIGDAAVELVGGFRVQSGGSVYQVRIEGGLEAFCPRVRVADMEWTVMPLAHELTFNLLRNRPDRTGPIASVMRGNWEAHREAVCWILANNSLSARHAAELRGLLPELSGTEPASSGSTPASSVSTLEFSGSKPESSGLPEPYGLTPEPSAPSPEKSDPSAATARAVRETGRKGGSAAVRFLPEGKTATVRPGTTLLEAAGRARAAVRTRCGGKASCLQCRVTVTDARGLSPPSDQERRKLGKDQLRRGVRLACQAVVWGDVTAAVPEDPLRAAVRAQMERLKRERPED
mgnify:CR=1 FL=1